MSNFLFDYESKNINQWDQIISYKNNGYIYSTIINLKNTKIIKPNSYSPERLKTLKEEFLSDSEGIYEKPDNIVLIMNESFSDLRNISGFKTNEDFLPYIDSLDKNVIKGNLVVSEFGGGTANSENEVLTGNSTVFLPQSIIAYQNNIHKNSNSFVKNLLEENYQTIAFHPYDRNNYNREFVYKSIGFEEYYSREHFSGEYLRWWPSDLDNFKQVIELYENKDEDKGFFLFNVTMQNHSPYTDEEFNNKILLEDTKLKFSDVEQYLSLLNLIHLST